MLRVLTLAGLGAIALALPLALLVESSLRTLIVVTVGGSGLGLAIAGAIGLVVLRLAGDEDGRALADVSRWTAGLGLGMLLDLVVLLRDPPAAIAPGSGWLSPDVLVAGAVAVVAIGAVGVLGTGVRGRAPRIRRPH